MIFRILSRAISFVLLVYVLGYAAFVVLLPRPAGDQGTDGIVVLTGAAGRIERGLDLIERRQARRLLISGVDRTVRREELAEQHSISPSIFACCVDLGRESVDTRSNADEVARWLKRRRFQSVRLITTDWHMPRARFEISRRVPPEVSILSDAVQSNPSFRQLFVEYNKFLLGRAAEIVGI